MILRHFFLPAMIHVLIVACFVFPDLDLSCLCLFADLLTISLPHVSDYCLALLFVCFTGFNKTGKPTLASACLLHDSSKTKPLDTS